MATVIFGDIETGKKYRKLGDKLDRSLTGKAAERPRWDTCMRRLYGTFGVPMSALYVKDHFDPASLEKVRPNTYLLSPCVSLLLQAHRQWQLPPNDVYLILSTTVQNSICLIVYRRCIQLTYIAFFLFLPSFLVSPFSLPLGLCFPVPLFPSAPLRLLSVTRFFFFSLPFSSSSFSLASCLLIGK